MTYLIFDWGNCIGAIDNIKTDDYELTECSIQDFSLHQWVEFCDSHSYCSENDIDALSQSHGHCGPLVDLLEEDAALGDVPQAAICACVRNIHTVPRCIVNNLPLVTFKN